MRTKSFQEAVQHVLDTANSYQQFVYAVTPIDGDIDRMMVSDGVAMDFAIIQYEEETAYYTIAWMPHMK